MLDDFFQRMRARLAGAAVALILITLIGTAGYMYLTGEQYSAIDCLYMTVITLTTIGYGEIVDMSHNPAARIFTMFLAVSGIGTLTYVFSTTTAFIVEGEFSEAVRRRKMEKAVAKMEHHFIVCGTGAVAYQIIQELASTGRDIVVIRQGDQKSGDHSLDQHIVMAGDPTDGDVLASAGAARAAGLFAAMDDDNENVIIALTSRQANPGLRIVAQCLDPKNASKMKAAGASATVSPTYIGGLRMASEMVRPAAVSFLDMMLRDKDLNLRVEEIPAPCPHMMISELGLSAFPNSLLLAVRSGGKWQFNPDQNAKLQQESVLVVMTTPEERQRVADHVGKKVSGVSR